MSLPKIIAISIAYMAFGGILLDFLGSAFYGEARSNAALIFGFVFIAGWIWLLGSLLGGSLKSGLFLLRLWIAFYGGLAIGLLPFVLLPHPMTLVIGALLGVAFATWVATGKAHWIHSGS